VAILLAGVAVMSSISQKKLRPLVAVVLENVSTSDATTPAGTFAENVAVTYKNGAIPVVAAAGLRTSADGDGALDGALKLANALIVKPDGAPVPTPKAGVTKPRACSDTVPAVPGIATSWTPEGPGLGELLGCTLGAELVLPPAHPAMAAAARNITTGTNRR
jgi:hypothetical protein